MTLRNLFTAALFTASALYAQDNLLTSAPAWYPACDNYGSEIDTADGFFQKDGSVKAGFTLTKKNSEAWPYIELICETGKPLTGTDSITVEYSCDTVLTMKLYQSDFGPEGDESYALYEYKLPASKTLKTVTAPISKFVQPSWAPSSSRKTALNLAKCDRIYFTPDLSAEDENGKVFVSVKTLKLKSASKK